MYFYDYIAENVYCVYPHTITELLIDITSKLMIRVINAEQANRMRQNALSVRHHMTKISNAIYSAAFDGYKGIVYSIKDLDQKDVDTLIDMLKHNGYHVYIDIDGNLSISWVK